MNNWTVIDYSQYWDVPREFVVRRGNVAYYFESPFDEALDGYAPNFYVYRIPAAAADIPMNRWNELRLSGERLPDIPVGDLRFLAEAILGHPMRRHLRFIHDSASEIVERTRHAT
jgi:hypothetical protein